MNSLHCLKTKFVNVTRKALSRRRGFTLVEVLVSIGIFSMSFGIISTTFVSAVKMQRRFLASTESLNEISFLMEYTARALRMAIKDRVPTCLSAQNMNYEKTHGGAGIKFKNSKGKCQEFYLDGTTLKESVDNGAQVNDMTSPKVKVISFNIGPETSWDQEDDEQPRVTIFMEFESAVDGSKTKMQTTVSQRNPDIRQ